jgi:hypothetical protein
VLSGSWDDLANLPEVRAAAELCCRPNAVYTAASAKCTRTGRWVQTVQLEV